MRAERLVLLIVIQVIICSCQIAEKIDGIWISYDWMESTNLDEYKQLRNKVKEGKESYSEEFLLHLDSMHNHKIDDKQIFQFGKDSLATAHFNETRYEGYNKAVYPYSFTEDSIVLYKDAEEFFSFRIEQLRNDKLIIGYRIEEGFITDHRITFQPLKRFNCKISLQELKSLFAGNTFLLDKINTEITFHGYDRFNGELEVNNTRNTFNIEMDDHWYIADIYNEMFLVIGSNLIQIITAGKDEIIGYMYGENNSKIVLKKI